MAQDVALHNDGCRRVADPKRAGGRKKQRRALGLFFAKLLLNALWAPLFFGLHHLALAFAKIVVLWLVLAATLRAFSPHSTSLSFVD